MIGNTPQPVDILDVFPELFSPETFVLDAQVIDIEAGMFVQRPGQEATTIWLAGDNGNMRCATKRNELGSNGAIQNI